MDRQRRSGKDRKTKKPKRSKMTVLVDGSFDKEAVVTMDTEGNDKA